MSFIQNPGLTAEQLAAAALATQAGATNIADKVELVRLQTVTVATKVEEVKATTAATTAQVASSSATLQATQTQVLSAVDSINTKTPALVSGRQPVDGSGVVQPVSGTVAVTGAGDASAANQATEIARLDTLVAKDFATQTTLAAVLAKIIASPATEATLAAVLAKIIASPATEATLAALNAKVTAVNTGAVVLAAGTANIGDVDVLTLPALPAGSNNIGDVDVLTLPALPAGSNNIGDVDVLTLPALVAGSANIGDVDVLTLPAITGTVTVTGVATETTLAAVNTKLITQKTCKSAVINLTSTGTLVSLVAGKKIKVYAICLVCSAALTVNLRSGASTALEGPQLFALSGGKAMAVTPPNFLVATAQGESLDMVIVGVGTVAGVVSYFDDDAA